MKAGARVLVKSLPLYLLGIVTHISGNTANVHLDKNSNVAVPLDKLIQILYFDKFIPNKLDKIWFKDHEKLVKPNDYDIKDFFLSKKPYTPTIPLLTCMFYWANVHVFENKLKIPKIEINSRKKGLSGYYSPKDDTLVISPKSNFTPKEAWETFTHELVHTYQYQVDRAESGFDPKSGYHGKTFTKWAGPLKEIAGTNLTQFHDLASIDVEETGEDTGKHSFYVFMCQVPVLGSVSYYACKDAKLENVQAVKKAIRSKFGITAKYSIRTLSNPALLNSITGSRSSSGTSSSKVGDYYVTKLGKSVFESIFNTAKPLNKE
ncbi:MAG: hypothetical protein KGH75_03110 [Rhodospirillales bacterium]|nr:hypothetical protein [Rhodospirillales bacterium]